MIILGYSCYVFDSAACIVVDGILIAACQEERFIREKNTGAFPINAINYCLSEAGVTIEEVDHVAFYWSPLKGVAKRLIQIAKGFPQTLNFWSSHSERWWSLLRAHYEFNIKLNIINKKLVKFKYHRIKHHLCHASSSFLISPFEEANIIVIDGSGEIESTSLAVGKINNIDFVSSTNFPHSLGYIYVSLTQYLGFKPDCDEYKVMALASMGNKSEYYDRFCNIVKLLPKGEYQVDLSYFNYPKGIRDPWVSTKFLNEFGQLRKKDEAITVNHQNIAWALQRRLEDVAIHCAMYLYDKNPVQNLIVSGGCALNCVMNERLREETPYTNVWVISAPNDAGTSIGAAFWVYNNILNNERKFIYESAYLGPSFSEDEYLDVLQDSAYLYVRLDDEELYKKVAEILSEKKIIGWFQGRTEFGPRALGNRSILADPRDMQMKDIVNEKIKHREGFRPFAPAILEEEVKDYFHNGRSIPFMNFVLKVREDKAKLIPAVIHIDNTARVQTVCKNNNFRFYRLISEFRKITGIPVILNTSFNDSGEPIVNSPQDALRCFSRTSLDYLVMGNYIVKRTDSERG